MIKDIESSACAKISSSSFCDKICPSGDYDTIGSSGDYDTIGSSDDLAKIDSTGKYAIICCAGDKSIAKAKKVSWITLAEWKYSEEKKHNIPVCLTTPTSKEVGFLGQARSNLPL